VNLEEDRAARERIMRALDLRMSSGVESLSREELSAFKVDQNESIRLIDTSKGIWNPSAFEATLTILSSGDGPYADQQIAPGVWAYHYRAGSIDGDNRKLRRAYELALPLIMWRKLEKGVFVPIYPVYVTGDDQAGRIFTVSLDEIRFLGDPEGLSVDARRYAEQIVKRRLHQPEFRGRVLRAYERPQLLDAAHIVPDSHDQGEATVRNGLALCKIHHAAYDANLLGISPDNIVHINRELLDIVDGPMLQHGLKDMHHQTLLWSPRAAHDRPDPDRLRYRFDLFQNAS
jgi:putative restriction endonuclease